MFLLFLTHHSFLLGELGTFALVKLVLCGGELHLLKMKTYLLEVLNRVLTKLCLSMPKKGKNLQVSFLLEKKDNKCTQMHRVKHHLIA